MFKNKFIGELQNSLDVIIDNCFNSEICNVKNTVIPSGNSDSYRIDVGLLDLNISIVLSNELNWISEPYDTVTYEFFDDRRKGLDNVTLWRI